MMLLYTIVPPEVVFGENDQGEPVSLPENQTHELNLNGRKFMLRQLQNGQFQIDRLISTNPEDYLNPDWQPGALISVVHEKSAVQSGN